MSMDENYTYITLSIIQAFLSLFGSSLILTAIARFHYLKNTTNIFVASLAVSDLIIGPLMTCVYEPTNILQGLSSDVSTYSVWRSLCVCGLAVAFLGGGLEVVSLFGIALERYIYIQHPMKYSTLMSARKAVFAVIFLWIFAFSLMLPAVLLNVKLEPGDWCLTGSVLDTNYYWKFVVPCFIVVSFMIITMYSKIALTAKAKNKTGVHQLFQKSETKTIKASRKDFKVVKMMILILGIYLVSYIPLMILIAITDAGASNSLIIVYFVSVTLWKVSSWSNALVYGFMNRQFRMAFITILHLKRFYTSTELETLHTIH